MKQLSFLNLWRWNWGVNSFSFRDATYQECSQTPSTKFHIESKTKLLANWYMLEVKIQFSSGRTKGVIYFDSHNKKGDVLSLNFPLFSKRMCKRLIYLKEGGKLSLDLGLSKESFELQHLRLVRVTQNFARSRMLMKLQTVYPQRYSFNQIRNATLPLWQRIQLYNFGKAQTPDIRTLWADYCQLFNDATEDAPYPNWIKKFDTLTDEMRATMYTQATLFNHQPLISVIMPVYNSNLNFLEQAINSVRKQIYPNWELCIADDASSNPKVRIFLEHCAQQDKRIKIVFHETNGHISAASNSALAIAQGEWIALLDHDDMLAEHALFCVIQAINQHPVCRIIYSDEDKIDESGVRSDPYFKCDWNPDLFYSHNMISHLGVYHADLIRQVKGFRIGFEGSQDYDLALRCIEHITPAQIHHIPRVLYHWRIHGESTAYSIETKPYAIQAGENAINEHFQRQDIAAQATSTECGYRVRYALPERLPLVSLIILTRNQYKLLYKCVQSILAKTTYPSYEVLIVDNGSDDAATLRFLKKISTKPNFQIIRDKRPFNYSALNNVAVKLAKGEIIGLLNNDIEVINPDWLSEMVSHALRSDVGPVGARLWYADNTLQHAGVILGINRLAGHAHRFLPRNHTGYCGRANLTQSFSAITGACMLVRKSIYQALGGFNETELQVACNDVDFCLRARAAGYRVVWTPYAELYHHESSSRGADDTPEKIARSVKEIAYMQQHWSEILQHDPAYSPNLTIYHEDFSLAWPPRVTPIVPENFA